MFLLIPDNLADDGCRGWIRDRERRELMLKMPQNDTLDRFGGERDRPCPKHARDEPKH